MNYKNKFRTCLQIASLVEAGWAFFTILFCGLKDIRSRSFKWSFKGFSFWSFLKEFEVSRSYFWPPKRRRLGWWSALWIFVACNLDLLFLVCNHVERRPCWRSIHRIFFSKNLHKNRVQFREKRNALLTTNMAAVTSHANQQESVSTHQVASGYANLLEQKKFFT